jgi:hypothetical protein
MIASIIVEREDKASKRVSLRQPPTRGGDMSSTGEDGGEKGSLRKKLMQQIKRVAHGSRSDLRSSAELEFSRKEQLSLKQASNVYKEMLLAKSCLLVEQYNKLITNADGFYVEVPKILDGKVNTARIEIEFTENDKMEYEKEFMPKGINDNFCVVL